jgi:starvation-inducible DNA-binding protein
MTNALEAVSCSYTRPVCVGGNTGSLCSRTKDFHRQMKEPDFRCYHLLLDEQAEQIFAITDDLGQGRKIDGTRSPQSLICRIISAQKQESRIRCAERR